MTTSSLTMVLTDIRAEKFYCSINRQVCIMSLETKDRSGGFRWELRKNDNIETGKTERWDKKGQHIGYVQKRIVTIKDFDGEKRTLRTDFYNLDGVSTRQPTFGVYDDQLAGRYHGENSKNWKPTQLRLNELIGLLNSGYAVAPGKYDPPPEKSRRSSKYQAYQRLILFDGDEWSAMCPAPMSLDELIERFPTLPDDFYWIGESISSRSSLKPEMRFRLLMVLPGPIFKEDSDAWECLIDDVLERYPFIASGPAIDRARASYGNGRDGIESRILGGVVSLHQLGKWFAAGREQQAENARAEAEKEEQRKRGNEQARERGRIAAELKKRGHDTVALPSDLDDPIQVYMKTDPADELTRHGFASWEYENTWNWHESGPGRSFELVNEVIKPYSHSVQQASPNKVSTRPVNAHRFLLWNLYGLDMTQNTDKYQLRCELADDGYGMHPRIYAENMRAFNKQAEQAGLLRSHDEKIKAVQEGNLSPYAIRRQPPKLVKEPFEIALANIEDNRVRIKNALRQPNKVVLLKSWTGDGKGEGCITLALDGEKFMMGASTQENADEDAERFRQAAEKAGIELNVLRWYPVNHKFDPKIPVDERLDNGAMCAFADIREAYQSKGGNPYTICASCPFHEQCEEQGYLSQKPKMREADVLIFCFPGIVTSPDYEVQAERYLELPDELARDTNGQLIPKRNDKGEIVRDEGGDPIYEYEKRYRSVIYDEATAQDLFVKYHLPIRLIEQWRDMWEGERLGEFAQDLLYALAEKDPIPKFRRVVKAYTQVADEIVEQMCALRYSATFTGLPADTDKVGFKGYMYINETQASLPVAKDWEVYNQLKKDGVQVLKPDVTSKTHLNFRDLDHAVSYKIFDRTDAESIHNMPTVSSRKNWTYWHRLKALFDEFPHDEMLPLVFPDRKSGSKTNHISWHIHPRLYPKVPRVIFMGASLDIELAQSALRGYSDDMFVEETPPTKFKPGASFLQLATAKYPRRTLLERGKGIGKYIGLSRIGKKVTGLIRKEIRQNPSKKFGIITFKWIVDTFRNAWCGECPNLVYFENFARAKGTNPELDVLFVLGIPEIPQYDVEVAAKVMFGATERGATPLDTTRLEIDAQPDGCPYIDFRMQRAWRLLVVESLLQPVGRGRLNLKPRCVVALTAVRLPNLTDRKETVLFDLVDWEVAGSLDRLPQIAAEREKKITSFKDRFESGETVYAIAKDEGIQWKTVKRIVTPYRGDQVDNVLVKRDSRVTIGENLTKLQKDILSCFETASEKELKTGDIVKIVGRARSKVTIGISKLVDRFYLERIKHGCYRLLTPESRDLRLRFVITVMLHLFVEPHTNFQIADILENPLEDINTALKKLGESSWCFLHEQDGSSEFVVDINRDLQERFEIFADTDVEHLLASGSVYGDHHVFMLCDLKMLKAHGEQQFIDTVYEGFRLPDDASIVYTDFSKWSALKLIPCRPMGG